MDRILLIGSLLLTACSGSLSRRSYDEIKAAIPLGPEIARVRVEIANGTLGIAPPEDVSVSSEVSYAGGVRRAADTTEDLAKLEQVSIAMTHAVDPERPDTLVLRGPQLPPGVAGLIAFEAGIRVPAGIELEVIVSENGHVTLEDRGARSVVRTGRGDLRFGRCAGGVEARTGRGTVLAFGHRGDLDVRSMAGDVQALVEQPGDDIRLVTGQGTVQCRVPESLQFELDARAEIGKIGTGFDLEVQRVGEFGAVLVGREGAGSTRVVLRTGSGHIAFVPHKFD